MTAEAGGGAAAGPGWAGQRRAAGPELRAGGAAGWEGSGWAGVGFALRPPAGGEVSEGR